jgi:hypothetical protein
MDRNLKTESIELCKNILEGHSYSFHMFRKIFQSKIDNDDTMIDFWYDIGNFKNMRLYKYLTELGYRKQGTILYRKT